MIQDLQNAHQLIFKGKHPEFSFEVVLKVVQDLEKLIQQEVAKSKVPVENPNGSE